MLASALRLKTHKVSAIWVYPSGAKIGSYKHSPSDCSLSSEFISGEATFEAGGTLLPPVENRRRAHADGMVMMVAANCCHHRGGPEWKAFCVNAYQWSLCGMAVFEHMSRCLCGTFEFDG